MFTIEKMLVPNKGTRGKHRPIAIVDHITIGKRSSVINTFMRPGGNSSHYLVCRDGHILQLVELNSRAHTNGFVRSPKSPLVKQMGNLNANYYTVTIEHEGYEDQGGDGSLTEEQFAASCWLHKHIQTEVESTYGNRIPLNSHQVIAHNQIDSQKGTCPGVNFPWGRLYTELARADNMTLAEYEEDMQYRKTGSGLSVDAQAFITRIRALENTLTHPIYAGEARNKLMRMEPVIGLMGLSGEVTAETIVQRVKELEEIGISGGKWIDEVYRKLAIGIQHAKNVGLIV